MLGLALPAAAMSLGHRDPGWEMCPPPTSNFFVKRRGEPLPSCKVLMYRSSRFPCFGLHRPYFLPMSLFGDRGEEAVEEFAVPTPQDTDAIMCQSLDRHPRSLGSLRKWGREAWRGGEACPGTSPWCFISTDFSLCRCTRVCSAWGCAHHASSRLLGPGSHRDRPSRVPER